MSSDTKAELQAIGVAFHPLRNIDDVADLLEAAARVPAATPRRYERIAGWLSMMHRGCIATAFQIGRLLSRLALDSAGPDAGVVRPFEALVARIPPSDGQVVVTARTKCVVCCGDLLEAMNDHDKLLCSHPQLFTRDGAMADCTLLWKRCGKCKAHHYYSYAVGGEALPDGKVQVYPGWDGLFYSAAARARRTTTTRTPSGVRPSLTARSKSTPAGIVCSTHTSPSTRSSRRSC
jgi:hypothetical protein